MTDELPGCFITFEGLDGSGKSTQLEMLAKWLRSLGIPVETTREPGGTALGERLRDLLVRTGPAAPLPSAELALLTASRAQNVEQFILPKLQAGAVVLCDRFHDATEAYQGGGRGLAVEEIHALHRALCHNLQPDRTFILDLDPGTSVERARSRLQQASSGESRFEQESADFFARVANRYLAIAKREAQRCRVVSARGTAEEIFRVVSTEVQDLISPYLVRPASRTPRLPHP